MVANTSENFINHANPLSDSESEVLVILYEISQQLCVWCRRLPLPPWSLSEIGNREPPVLLLAQQPLRNVLTGRAGKTGGKTGIFGNSIQKLNYKPYKMI